MKKLIFLLFLISVNFVALAQAGADADGGDAMRAHGKIYVVMTVVITIVTGLLLYLIRLDRKISRIEKQNN